MRYRTYKKDQWELHWMSCGMSQCQILVRTLKQHRELKTSNLAGTTLTVLNTAEHTPKKKTLCLFFLLWKILVLAFWHAYKFLVGWTIRFMDPLLFGDYPASMRKRVGQRLPRFSPVQSALIKGSFNFVGINHYTTYYAQQNVTNLIGVVLNDTIADSGATTVRKLNVLQPVMCCTSTAPYWHNDHFVFIQCSAQRRQAHCRQGTGNKELAFIRYLNILWKAWNEFGFVQVQAASIWLYIVPRGMRSLMNYIKEKYGNPPVVITENGN